MTKLSSFRFPWYRQKTDHTYLKNFLFGVEDSLVSTVGLLAGVSVASASRATIITTGLVLIVVEGFSMGIGSFLTEETSEEMFGIKTPPGLALRGGLTMLFSYVIAGFIPLLPYFFWDANLAIYISVFSSLLGLFFLGLGTALYFKRPLPLKRGLKMLLLGGLAVLAGVAIGKTFHL